MVGTSETKALQKRIVELEEQVSRLKKDLIHDSLTGLKTRAFFEEEARINFEPPTTAQSDERKKLFGFTHISFLFFDVDHFKRINDTYGHDVGDAVLKKIATCIVFALRQEDIAARWGGEEIIVSLFGANENDAYETARRILNSVQNLRFEEATDLKVTISCGVTTTSQRIAFKEFVRRADKALYRAKESGRNSIVRYSELVDENPPNSQQKNLFPTKNLW